MSGQAYPQTAFNSLLSFRPLVYALKKNIEEGNSGMQKLYAHVVSELEARPELMGTIHDLSLLDPYHELIEELLSAVFPPTTANFMYGISYPFRNLAVYASPHFRKWLIKPGTNEILLEESAASSLHQQRLEFAYGMILKKYYGFSNPESSRVVYTMPDPQTGLTRFMEMRLDARFVEVLPAGDMPAMPESLLDPETNRLYSLTELMQLIPLDQFIFQGLTVLRINDVTELEVIGEMKNALLEFDGLKGSASFIKLEKLVQDLMGMRDLTIGITPFHRIQQHYVYPDLHNSHSLLFRSCAGSKEKDEISDYCKILFRDAAEPVLYQLPDRDATSRIQFLINYYLSGCRSIIICPLKKDNELLGLLEISAPQAGYLQAQHIQHIAPVVPMFTLSMEKSLEQLKNEVDRLIKQEFTAVQPAVEWKFTDTTLQYMSDKLQQKDSRIGRIIFDQVYPLYGAIDIRGSSMARVASVQADLLAQLKLAGQLVEKTQARISFPILSELAARIQQYSKQVQECLRSNEELAVYEFLQGPFQSFVNHLQNTTPELAPEISEWMAALDPQRNCLFQQRKAYEQSVALINEQLARLIDKEQQAAQKIYPHYFERFITDGLEFNMYVGQSISPRKKMDELYLRNLRMWQLSLLVKAACMTHSLEKELPIPLQTTQLILAGSQAMTICFRTEERKFDVDGAGNTRYEIIKKRIDKVHIRETGERLTQPGKIAIVYTQAKDADEYRDYLDYLQAKGLLEPLIENLDLEELQGVSGLKALRAVIRF